MALTDEQRAYIDVHNLCILATGKKDGSPQISSVYYDWDGEHLYISVTSDRAKWRNAMRNPNIAVLIPDGRKQLILYGTASGIEHAPERDERIIGIRKRWGRPVPEDVDRAAFTKELDEALRVVLRFTPQRAFSND
jgi:PPOX class probable F420-dependent enzyme